MVDPLCSALNDKYTLVREQSSKILSNSKEVRVIQPLIAALKDFDPSVRQWALKGTKQLTGENFGMHPAKWQKGGTITRSQQSSKPLKHNKTTQHTTLFLCLFLRLLFNFKSD